MLHDAERIGHPNATWGITEGNPIHDDVREIARMVGVDFAVDVTLNREQKITGGVCRRSVPRAPRRLRVGHARRDAGGRRAVRRRPHHQFRLSARSESLSGGEGDVGGGQGRQAGRDDRLRRRVLRRPAVHGSYGEVLASQPSPEKLLAMINAPGYSVPDQWQVQIQAQLQMKANVMVKTGGLTPDAVRAAHFQPVDDVGAAVAEAMRDAGPGATLCVLPHGPQTIPYLRLKANLDELGIWKLFRD